MLMERTYTILSATNIDMKSTLLIDCLECYAFLVDVVFGGYEDVNMLIAVCSDKLLKFLLVQFHEIDKCSVPYHSPF